MSLQPTSATEAERYAERARTDLERALAQLKVNLQPAQLKAEAFDALQARTPDWMGAYWRFVRSPIGVALIGATAASAVSTRWARQRRLRRRRP